MTNVSLRLAFACTTGAVLTVVALAACSTGSSDSDSDSAIATTIPGSESPSAGIVITLTGSDTETCELIFAASNTVNGTLSEITDEPCAPGAPNTDSATLTFTSEPGVCGPGQGSFTFTTSDGSATSAPATVTVDIPCIEVDTD